MKSSFTKLTKEVGMARNDVIEVITDLKKIGFVNVTSGNEVYFMEDGRKHVGVCTSPTAKSAQDKEERCTIKAPSILHKTDVACKPSIEAKSKHDVLNSINELATKLNKPVIEIVDLDLKSQALVKLAALMSDDISDLLLGVKADLERAAA
jgi:hypothetical protein